MRINQLLENNTENFIKDFYNNTTENPINHRERILDNHTVIELYKDNNTIRISDIRSLNPKTGAGTKTLKFLKSLADKYNTKLTLTAKPYHNNNEYITDLETLAKWYYKNGFELDDDNLTDDINDLDGLEELNMIYYPK